MKVLSLNGQGLALLLFFVFTACDRLAPPAGELGKLVPVKIRSVSVKGYGEVSGTRSAGDEKRIVGQPIVRDLGEGLMAEITVEEDISALRADLETDKTFRVIALKTDGTYYAHADFTVGGGSDYSSPDLHVPENVECDFICISFNSKEDLPAMSAATDISALTLDASKDFLYQRIRTSINSSNSTLSFDNLRHQFTKVTLILDSNDRTITNVANNSIKMSPVATPTAFDLTATANALSGTAPGDKFFALGLNSGVWQGLLRLLPTSGASTLSLPAEAITVDNSWKSEAKDFQLSVLEVRKSYTVRLKLVTNVTRIGYFAGELTPNASGVWKFKRELYVQNADASKSMQWSTDQNNAQGGTDDTHGKANTLALNNAGDSYTNPAAELCFNKNTGSIAAVTDANYIWYLPAQKQLMAIWAVHESFESSAKFTPNYYYWASTEHTTPSRAWGMICSNGNTFDNGKIYDYLVRCVREK